MPKRPDFLIERPEGQDSASGDVLSELIDSVHLKTWLHGHLDLGRPWGLRFIEQRDLAFLYLVGRGGAELQVEGAQPVSLAAGDLALIPNGEGHTLRDGRGAPLHVFGQGECRRSSSSVPLKLGGAGPRTTLLATSFRFGAGRRTLLMERLPPVIHISPGSSGQGPWLPAIVQLLISESASKLPAADVVMSRLADVLLVQALRTFIAGEGCAEYGLRAIVDPLVGAALAAVHREPNRAWTVAELGRVAGMSRSAFAARFTQLVGQPPLEYVARWRMQKAAQLLRQSTLPLLEIAERVGYGSEAAFTRAFKRFEGQPPARYRREAALPPPG